MSKDEWKKLTKNDWTKWVAVVGRMLLAYALVFAQGAWAAQNQATKDKAASPQKAAAQRTSEKQPAATTTGKAQTAQAQGEESESAAAEEKPSGDGRHEGIKVHGHWTIEVRNPDGRVVSHREFENSYTTTNRVLSRLLTRSASPGLWSVSLVTDGICQFQSSPSDCIIGEAGYTAVPGYTFSNLTVTGASSADIITLSGSATATYSGNIKSVQSIIFICSNTFAPGSPCPSNGGNGFTAAMLTTPQPVSAGQTIAVTVNISFS